MITNFEEETKPLTAKEIVIKTQVVEILENAKGKERAITNERICLLLEFNQDTKVSSPRLRKIINHIRNNNEVSCLVASSKGYYTSSSIEESKDHLESLYQRAMAILKVYSSLKTQSEDKFQTKKYEKLKKVKCRILITAKGFSSLGISSTKAD